jgi:hypothetical protein
MLQAHLKSLEEAKKGTSCPMFWFPFMEISGWKPVAEMFQLPNLPRLMAIGMHSHFGDASPLFWHFAKTLFSDIDVQCSATGKINMVTNLNVLGFVNYITGDTIQLSDT